MKQIAFYILISTLTVTMFSCHNHSDGHDHGHNHGTSQTNVKEENSNGMAEIYFSSDQAQQSGLQTDTVRPASFHQVIKTSGEVLSAQGDERTISATISGIVSFNKSSLNAGTSIKAGETIIGISSRNIMEGDISQKAIVNYNIAKQDFERAESLIKEKLISQSEYNTLKLTYENAKIAYDAVGKNQTAKGTGITSPINGFIKNTLVSEGEFVEVGQPLFIVSQNRRLQLQANVSERYYNDLDNIVSANFSTPFDQHIYKLSDMNGKLISYGRSASSEDYYIPVNFEFDNSRRILPGSFVEIYLISRPKGNTITVPITALIEEQGIYSVFISLNNEHYKKQEVKIGQSDGERIEILSGLNQGDIVVTKAAYHVKLASASAAIPHSHEH